MIEFRAVRGETGQLFRQLLVERGLQLGNEGEAIVSWGVRLDGETRPSLNATAGWDKYEELSKMREAGVPTPPFTIDGKGLQFPILGRRRSHTKAKDIIPILQNDKEFEWRLAGKASDYFVQYVPKQGEYRVWAYRNRPLAVYQKLMRYPERYTRIGWNWDLGFAFDFVREAPEDLRQLGPQSIKALGLDFGAVDILHGMDGKYYVLEVNTAPGTQGIRTGIRKLADRVMKWVEAGYPARGVAQ